MLGGAAVKVFSSNLSIPTDDRPEGIPDIFMAPRGPFTSRLLERIQNGALPGPPCGIVICSVCV